MYTKDDLKRFLLDIGCRNDDTVLVHSSVNHIGEVIGKVDSIVDAFMEYFSEGLLVFPTLTFSFVNIEHPIYNVKETPSCVGAVPEIFRKRPGVVRSLHPTHSVAACGKNASQFIEGHEKFNTPCARQSPWGKIVDRQGKILFIGTGLSCNTVINAVEEWVGVPCALTEAETPFKVIKEDGSLIDVSSKRQVGNHSRFYGKLEKIFLEKGVMESFRFGEAKTFVADSKKMTDLVAELLNRDIYLLADDRPIPAV